MGYTHTQVLQCGACLNHAVAIVSVQYALTKISAGPCFSRIKKKKHDITAAAGKTLDLLLHSSVELRVLRSEFITNILASNTSYDIIWLSTLIGLHFPPDTRRHGSVVPMDKPSLLIKSL